MLAAPNIEERLMETNRPDEIVRLATASNPQEAHLWRQALKEQGIRCRVVGDYLGSFGIVPPGHAVPELWVHCNDAERARSILDGLRKRTSDSG